MKFKYEISFGRKGFEFNDREEAVWDWSYTLKEAFEKVDETVRDVNPVPKTWTITEIKGAAIVASGCVIKQEGSHYYSILTERYQVLRGL